MSQLKNNNEPAEIESKSIPKFRGGMDFQTYFFQIKQFLGGYSLGPGSAPWADPPAEYVEVPALGAARNERAERDRNDRIREWHRIEGKCYQAVCVSIGNDRMALSHLW